MSVSRIKYPKTPHLPWSPGLTANDTRLLDCQQFEGKEVIVTEKLDGENTTMYTDYLHARSIDNRFHPSREWVKKLHGTISYLIPFGWRLCGENLYAQHSIPYSNLESYFYLFSIWDENNICIDWYQTLKWAESLGLKTPRVFYQGVWDKTKISQLSFDTDICEGFVVRTVQSFPFNRFEENVAKWVRKGHVATEEHWMNKPIIVNQILKHS
ncbi:RNA ligase [Candidatus Rubidus massiliensis]|nr:RNA ligase [Candidatus Rubidus massiliensis]